MKYIIGNWKMNGSKEICCSIAQTTLSSNITKDVTVIVAPPTPYLQLLKETLHKILCKLSHHITIPIYAHRSDLIIAGCCIYCARVVPYETKLYAGGHEVNLIKSDEGKYKSLNDDIILTDSDKLRCHCKQEYVLPKDCPCPW